MNVLWMTNAPLGDACAALGFARAQSGVESGRAKELLAIFDDAAEELLYLGVTPGELKARIDGKGAGGDEN